MDLRQGEEIGVTAILCVNGIWGHNCRVRLKRKREFGRKGKKERKRESDDELELDMIRCGVCVSLSFSLSLALCDGNTVFALFLFGLGLQWHVHACCLRVALLPSLQVGWDTRCGTHRHVTYPSSAVIIRRNPHVIQLRVLTPPLSPSLNHFRLRVLFLKLH